MRPSIISCLAFLLSFLAATQAKSSEDAVPLDKLPKAVATAVKDRFPRGHVLEAAQEVEEGKMLYEVTLKMGETIHDVIVTPSGKIEVIERVIAVDDLPRPIAAAIAAHFQTGVIKKAEEIIMVSDKEESLEYYEMVVSMNGKSAEVEVLINGQLRKHEPAASDVEDKDDDDVN